MTTSPTERTRAARRRAGGTLPRALGAHGMATLEDHVVGPVRRGARRAGVGLGRVTGWAALVVGFFNLLGGALLTLLADGFLDSVGVVFVVLGVLASVFGGGMLWLMGRWARRAAVGEVEGQLRRTLALRGESESPELARVLGVPLDEVEACAREMAHRGEIERDVDTERGVEVYRPLGWVGVEAATQQRELDEFERALDNAPASGQSRADSAPAAPPPPADADADADAAALELADEALEEEAVAAPRRSS